MAEAILLPGQVGVAHDLEISVPPILKGRYRASSGTVMRANQVEHAVKKATGVASWASGFGGSRDISFRFETTDQLTAGVEAARGMLEKLGYPVEEVNIIPRGTSLDEDNDDTLDEDENDGATALLIIERSIPVDEDGCRIEV